MFLSLGFSLTCGADHAAAKSKVFKSLCCVILSPGWVRNEFINKQINSSKQLWWVNGVKKTHTSVSAITDMYDSSRK